MVSIFFRFGGLFSCSFACSVPSFSLLTLSICAYAKLPSYGNILLLYTYADIPHQQLWPYQPLIHCNGPDRCGHFCFLSYQYPGYETVDKTG